MKKEPGRFSIEISLDKIKEWVLHHKKQAIGVVVLVVLIIIFAAAGTAGRNRRQDVTEGAYSSAAAGEEQAAAAGDGTADAKEQADDVLAGYSKAGEEDEVTKLLEKYYAAYASGDVAVVEECADPVSEMEKGYIGVFSQYAESYQDITAYLKGGYEENSYFVSAVYNLKFTDIDTLDPGMDFFYICTSDDGSLYINNIYSNFNMSSKEYETDAGVEDLIAEFEKADDVIALQKEIQDKYDQALEADEALKKIMDETLPAALSAWVAEYNRTQNGQTEVAEAGDTTESQETAGNEAGEADGNAENAENAADTENTGDAGEADNTGGTENTQNTQNTGDDGNTGDEAADNTDEGTDEEPEASQSYFEEGAVIHLTTATNIRESMSESASKVGVAFSGEQVTVIQSYEEGWTKVTWGEKTGYIKTEVLLDQ